jgi:H/ACA ribonucleoprotein complex subunit 3
MKSLLFLCKSCNKYTLNSLCPTCQEETENPAPPRFSPEDKYGKYRRILRKETQKNID